MNLHISRLVKLEAALALYLDMSDQPDPLCNNGGAVARAGEELRDFRDELREEIRLIRRLQRYSFSVEGEDG